MWRLKEGMRERAEAAEARVKALTDLLSRARKLTRNTFPGGGTITSEIDAFLASSDAAPESKPKWNLPPSDPRIFENMAGSVDAAPESKEGWVLVPKEPTLGMARAGLEALQKSGPFGWAAFDMYSAMLAAVPQEPQP
jgi:hypothetical protein